MVKNKKLPKNNKDLVIYQAPSGEIELRGDFSHETIWASQAQIAEVFNVDRSVVTKHIKNIYKEDELDRKGTCAKFAQVRDEGGRKVERTIEYYNLDMIISVGYRVNSKSATEFRKWATKTLRAYLVKGFAINKKQIKKNHQEFLKTVDSIKKLLPANTKLDSEAVLELVKEFSGTWTSLDAYDKDSLKKIGSTKRSVQVSAEELLESIAVLKKDLMKRGEATELFASERARGNIEGIIGSVMQSFGGKAVYPTAEEKASHLLYFIVKNHPFSDGNKRSGAWSFIWFLRKMKVKGYRNINPSALTALTLLIAESKPERKDQMIALVTQLLMIKSS